MRHFNIERPLNGQTFMVTGASGGIGGAIVERLALEGAKAIIHYSHDQEAALAVLDRIDGNGIILQADLSSAEAPFALWQKAVDFAGRIHGLVNSASMRNEISIDSDRSDWKIAWQREFQVNFFSAADLCREAIRHFQTEGGGRIVNIACHAGQRGSSTDFMPYGAAKAAMINLTKSIAQGFGRDGATAVCIAPGPVRTQSADNPLTIHGDAAAVGDIPIGDIADPAEIAELVAFVLRFGQDSLNGATLDVNGGSYMR